MPRDADGPSAAEPDLAGPTFDRVWRAGPAGRVGGWAMTVLFAALSLAALAGAVGLLGGSDGPSPGSSLVVSLANALVAACAWRFGAYPLLGASAGGVTVRNPLRSVTVGWEDVSGCGLSSRGLIIGRHSGPPVVAWAVQKPSLSTWLGRTSRADEVAGYLVARATAVAGPGAGRRPGTPGRRGVP